MARLWPAYVMRHGPFLACLVFANEKAWVSRTGSASDWCALQEALYKCTDTIQYNTPISIILHSMFIPTIGYYSVHLPVQFQANFQSERLVQLQCSKMCLSMMVRFHTNSSPSCVSLLVTPSSSLQSRRALRSSSQADFVVILTTFGDRAFVFTTPG